jgi:small neutral amino acid transporter SnatA (MarC family)
VDSLEYQSIDAALVIDTFLLLLIGIGPKIALVPFLELTSDLDATTKRQVTRKMITTAATVAVLLAVFGGLLTRLLHFSTGALGIASGLILFVIAVSMVLKTDSVETAHPATTTDPAKLAVFPLAVPYLLNPAGIIALVTISAEVRSFSVALVAAGLLVLVLVIDVVVFRWANRVGDHLDENRMLVTEKVFGFLLAAVGVQLVLDGLVDVGALHLTGH